MKNTTLDNPNILVEDERILELDWIIDEVKQSGLEKLMSLSVEYIGKLWRKYPCRRAAE